MRITAQAKEENRRRLLEIGAALFRDKGFAETSTRDLAAAAGMATGTIFNYYPNKESLGMALLADAMAVGRAKHSRRRRRGETLVEELFSLINDELRALRPHRGFAAPVLEVALSPFARSEASKEGERTRIEHLETVAAIMRRFGIEELDAVASHFYWTLYLGVLAFWTRDDSPRQEDTLLVIDQSMQLFASTFTAGRNAENEGGDS